MIPVPKSGDSSESITVSARPPTRRLTIGIDCAISLRIHLVEAAGLQSRDGICTKKSLPASIRWLIASSSLALIEDFLWRLSRPIYSRIRFLKALLARSKNDETGQFSFRKELRVLKDKVDAPSARSTGR